MFGLGLISGLVKLIKVKDHSTAATSAVNSDGVDMWQDGGYDGVLFLTSFGTPAVDNTINAAQSDDDGSVDDYTDLEASKTVPGASDEDAYLEIFRPTKRWVRCEAARGTSSTLESIWALLYGPRDSRKVTNVVSGTITGKSLISPAEGTA